MSRGVVLWPDAEAGRAVRDLWDVLTERGLPSLATHTHRLHQPHVSLTVGEHLPAREALSALGCVPAAPIPLQVEAVAVFPGGHLILPVVVNQGLLDEQRRVHDAVDAVMVDPWPYYRPGAWMPHITLGMSYSPDQLALALPLVLASLPVEGHLDHGGVEDGSSGENWPAPATERTD